jgi:hypothetical protein
MDENAQTVEVQSRRDSANSDSDDAHFSGDAFPGCFRLTAKFIPARQRDCQVPGWERPGSGVGRLGQHSRL